MSSKEAVAKLKYARLSAKKVNQVLKEIRNKKVYDAERILCFLPQKAAFHIKKTLASAVANAVNNEKMDKSSLIISEAIVGQGMTIKRFRAAAKGRGVSIEKPTAHITIKVKEIDSGSKN